MELKIRTRELVVSATISLVPSVKIWSGLQRVSARTSEPYLSLWVKVVYPMTTLARGLLVKAQRGAKAGGNETIPKTVIRIFLRKNRFKGKNLSNRERTINPKTVC